MQDRAAAARLGTALRGLRHDRSTHVASLARSKEPEELAERMLGATRERNMLAQEKVCCVLCAVCGFPDAVPCVYQGTSILQKTWPQDHVLPCDVGMRVYLLS